MIDHTYHAAFQGTGHKRCRSLACMGLTCCARESACERGLGGAHPRVERHHLLEHHPLMELPPRDAQNSVLARVARTFHALVSWLGLLLFPILELPLPLRLQPPLKMHKQASKQGPPDGNSKRN